LDPRTLHELHFERVDRTRFPAVELAYTQGRRGGTYPAVMNAANEVAVAAFLERTLAFTDIVEVIEEVLESHEATEATSLDQVLSADTWARQEAAAAIKKRTPVGAGS
jgi:1-deoxy-D-xylulose-5-phosphate reductoisomerase